MHVSCKISSLQQNVFLCLSNFKDHKDKFKLNLAILSLGDIGFKTVVSVIYTFIYIYVCMFVECVVLVINKSTTR